MGRFLCRIGWHAWSMWERVGEATGVRWSLLGPSKMVGVVYHRTCDKCGLPQTKIDQIT